MNTQPYELIKKQKITMLLMTNDIPQDNYISDVTVC